MILVNSTIVCIKTAQLDGREVHQGGKVTEIAAFKGAIWELSTNLTSAMCSRLKHSTLEINILRCIQLKTPSKMDVAPWDKHWIKRE